MDGSITADVPDQIGRLPAEATHLFLSVGGNDALGESGIALHFAEMKDPVRDKLIRFELVETIGKSRFHPTVGSAVDDYLATSGDDPSERSN